MNQKNAILLVSFGTTYAESRKNTIDKLLEDISKAFPDSRIYQAWTSEKIIHILKERDNLYIPTIKEAMAQILEDGITSLRVQPTHIVNGIENQMMTKTILSLSSSKMTVRFGLPLLTSDKDNRLVLSAIQKEFSDIPSDEALVLMGHGTTKEAHSAYATLDKLLKNPGDINIFLGTMTPSSNLDMLIQKVSDTHPHRIHLAPFLFVAGKHASRDMAGKATTSWKSRFEAAGYEVVCHMKGLGEYEGIRKIYLEHLTYPIQIFPEKDRMQ